MNQRGIGARIVVEKGQIELGSEIAIGAERIFEALDHALVILAVLAQAHLQILAPQEIDEDRARNDGNERNLLLVEFAELIEPADRVVGLRLTMCEVYDGRVSQSRIVFAAR